MHLGAAEQLHFAHLPRGLDALGGDVDVQALGELRDRAHDRRGFAPLRQTGDEGAVDLDAAEREGLQVAERGEAGAEIVERERDAEVGELLHRCEIGLGIVEKHRLGDFELQPLGPQAGAAQRVDHRRDEAAAGELAGGDVDGDAHVARPARRLGAGGPDDPFAERVDQADFLRYGNELARRNQPAPRMAPARQRLDRDDAVVGEADDRLVMEFELVVGERAAQVALELHPLDRTRGHFRPEQAIARRGRLSSRRRARRRPSSAVRRPCRRAPARALRRSKRRRRRRSRRSRAARAPLRRFRRRASRPRRREAIGP